MIRLLIIFGKDCLNMLWYIIFTILCIPVLVKAYALAFWNWIRGKKFDD